MPSHLHEALLLLFRYRQVLAPELLRDALHVELPDYTEVRIDSADLTDIQPAEYRADLVILLLHGSPVLGIVLELQLPSIDQRLDFLTRCRYTARNPPAMKELMRSFTAAKSSDRQTPPESL